MEKMNSAGEKSEEALTFKIFEPRKSNLSLCSDSFSLSSSGTGGFPSLGQTSAPLSAGGDDVARSFNFDFTSFRGSQSSPTNLFSPDLLRGPMTGYSGDPNLPKRLHVSNIPFRYR